MSGLSNARVIVAGAGAFGSAIALRLVQSGARMTLVDPDLGLGRSASAVAAGMLAPALESVLDPETNVPFAMLRAARKLWPAFEARIGRDIGLSRAGAAFVDLPGLEPRVEALRSKLKALGAEIAPPPASLDGLNAVFTPEDWRLSPAEALPALLGAFRAAGGTAVRGALAAVEPGAAVLADGAALSPTGCCWRPARRAWALLPSFPGWRRSRARSSAIPTSRRPPVRRPCGARAAMQQAARMASSSARPWRRAKTT